VSINDDFMCLVYTYGLYMSAGEEHRAQHGERGKYTALAQETADKVEDALQAITDHVDPDVLAAIQLAATEPTGHLDTTELEGTPA
jgi:hypothetical protein